jgi:hypothetical protein
MQQIPTGSTVKLDASNRYASAYRRDSPYAEALAQGTGTVVGHATHPILGDTRALIVVDGTEDEPNTAPIGGDTPPFHVGIPDDALLVID